MSDTTSSERFEYLVNLDSTFLNGLDAVHPRVVHRADCAYLTNDEGKTQMLPVTGEVVAEGIAAGAAGPTTITSSASVRGA